VKVTPEFIRNQQTSNPKLISVGIPTLTIFRPTLGVEYRIRAAGKNDDKACQHNQEMKDRTAREFRKTILVCGNE